MDQNAAEKKIESHPGGERDAPRHPDRPRAGGGLCGRVPLVRLVPASRSGAGVERREPHADPGDPAGPDGGCAQVGKISEITDGRPQGRPFYVICDCISAAHLV